MFSVTKVNGNNNSSSYRQYLMDSRDEVGNLPTSRNRGMQDEGENPDAIVNDCCSAGSVAVSTGDWSVFVLGNDDIWHEIAME